MTRQIRFTKSFTKQFSGLQPQQTIRFYERLAIFQDDPHDRRLRDHALRGSYLGYRSIDIGGDLRALYVESDAGLVTLAFIGSHSQLY